MNYIKKYWVLFILVFFISIFIKPAFCFLMLGALILFVSISAIVFLKEIDEKGIVCTGKVVNYETDSDGDKTPIVEFTPIGGEVVIDKPYVFSSISLSNFGTNEAVLNENVLVRYHPSNPTRFILSDEKGFNYFTFIFFILCGIGTIAIGICSFLGYILVG